MAYKKIYTPPYKPNQTAVYKVSRSKIELFKQCPRCFWLDARLKIKRPDGPPFQINKAIDELLKKEFDSYRAKSEPHPLMVEYGVEAVPMSHDDLEKWRYNFEGVTYVHPETNLHVFGAVDDVWIDKDGRVIVVDYKATAKATEVSISADWQISYKRQMEVYQWLLRRNGFEVGDKGYFVYANGRLDNPNFGNRVEFKTKIIEYVGNDSWVEPTIIEMKQCLDGGIPTVGTAAMGGECDFCAYAKARTKLTLEAIRAGK